MDRLIFLALAGIATLLVNPESSRADVVVNVNLPGDTLLEGTPNVDFTLSFTGNGSDSEAEFDSFTYALIVSNSGSATDPAFDPISSTNFVDLSPAQFGIVDQSPPSDPNIAFGQVNANAGSGFTASFPSTVMSFTLDTSSLVDGDIVTIDPNANGFAGVGLGSTSFSISSESASFNVVRAVAIPEPASAGLLGVASCFVVLRRRRI